MSHLPLTPLWLHGRYQIEGQAPDGDSLRFIPDHPEALRGEVFSRVVIHPDGGFTLRLDGVDAAETHYLSRAGMGVLSQAGIWPHEAASRLLSLLGFTSVVRTANETVVSAQPPSVRGSVALMRADRFGRAVGLAFAGTIGSEGELTPVLMDQSANATLAREGLAYPTFYTDTHELFCEHITQLTQSARLKRLGVWAEDKTHRGFNWQDLEGLCQRQLILPKLFRRLVDFAGIAKGASVEQFKESLVLEVGVVMLLPQRARVEFADLLEETHGQMRLLVSPEMILFAVD